MKPRRSILTVPGHIEKMHTKAAQSEADVILLDLEDSVPLAAKDKARDLVIDSLLNQEWNDKSVTVRINSLETAFGYRDLLEVAENAGQKLDTVVVPKVDHVQDVHFVSRLLDGIEMRHEFTNSIGIEAIIESARGLESVSETAGESVE